MGQQDAAVSELGYVELGVSNRDAWRDYATGVLGVTEADQSEVSARGVEIDDRTWETTSYNSPSIWGHKGALN